MKGMMTRSIFCILILVTGVLHTTGAAWAQETSVDIEELTPVDQRVADLNPLSSGQRQLSRGQRMPTAFEQLFRLPGTGQFFRADGALYAVFNQSTYGAYSNRGGSGFVPTIPDGTVFHIGSPLDGAMTGTGSMSFRAPGRIDQRILDEPGSGRLDGRHDHAMNAPPTTPIAERQMTPPPPVTARRVQYDARVRTIVTDADYRASRLRTLMRRAAEAPTSADE